MHFHSRNIMTECLTIPPTYDAATAPPPEYIKDAPAVVPPAVAEAQAPVRARCTALKHDGQQCSWVSRNDSEYCTQHWQMIVEFPARQEEQRERRAQEDERWRLIMARNRRRQEEQEARSRRRQEAVDASMERVRTSQQWRQEEEARGVAQACRRQEEARREAEQQAWERQVTAQRQAERDVAQRAWEKKSAWVRWTTVSPKLKQLRRERNVDGCIGGCLTGPGPFDAR